MTDTLPPLPDEFCRLLEQVVPADRLAAVLASFAAAKPTTFRINPLRGSVEEVRAELAAGGFILTPVPWYAEAFAVPPAQRRALTETAAFADGRIYIQNLASMLAPLLLAPQPDETVLDLAAAPGGKTLQLAALMRNRGRLSAVEAVKGRFFRLRANLARGGVTIARTFLMDGREVGRKCPGMFDRVLLDAPCSSEARFTRLDPQSWMHWSLKKVREAARKQKGLLESAVRSLKAGGALVYCTCSLSPEENELAVADALRRFGEALEILPVELPLANVQSGLTRWAGEGLPEALARSVRVLPNEVMDGFYLCRMGKRG